jgi:hypothetical protein
MSFIGNIKRSLKNSGKRRQTPVGPTPQSEREEPDSIPGGRLSYPQETHYLAPPLPPPSKPDLPDRPLEHDTASIKRVESPPLSAIENRGFPWNDRPGLRDPTDGATERGNGPPPIVRPVIPVPRMRTRSGPIAKVTEGSPDLPQWDVYNLGVPFPCYDHSVNCEGGRADEIYLFGGKQTTQVLSGFYRIDPGSNLPNIA